MMRRILAITLLIALGSPLVLPLLAATPDSPKFLPACCRKAGIHHCASPTANAPGAPVWQAPPCADFPVPDALQTPDTAALVAPNYPAFDSLREMIQLAPNQRLAETATPSAHPKRGPPALLA